MHKNLLFRVCQSKDEAQTFGFWSLQWANKLGFYCTKIYFHPIRSNGLFQKHFDLRKRNRFLHHNREEKAHIFLFFIYFKHLVPPTGFFWTNFLPCHSSKFSFPAILPSLLPCHFIQKGPSSWQ